MGGTEANIDLLEGLLEWSKITLISARLVRALNDGLLPYNLEEDLAELILALERYQEAHLGITRHNPY